MEGLEGLTGTHVVWAVVLAAGSASRFGGGKQYADIAGRSAVHRSLAAVRPHVGGVVVVLPAGDLWDADAVESVDAVVEGGTTRAASVRSALAVLPTDVDVVLIHDAAHPLATSDLCARVLAALTPRIDAVAPVLPIVEALVVSSPKGRAVGRVSRPAGLASVQMPCGFRRSVLDAVHASEPEGNEETALVLDALGQLATVPGEVTNVHVTTPADLDLARRLAVG